MPRRGRKVRRAPRRRKAKVARSLAMKSQMATVTESFEFQPLRANSIQNCVFQLSQFPRAATVAACYKWYKPVSVTWEYTPYFTVFQAGIGSATATAPTYYSYMNRTQDGQQPIGIQDQLSFVLSTGAKPRMFNRKIVTKYRPNWCSPGLVSVGTANGVVNEITQQGLKCQYAWLASPTTVSKAIPAPAYQIHPSANFIDVLNPITGEFDPVPGANIQVGVLTNGTMFNGHNVLISQDRTGYDDLICDVRCTVKWAFKDPNPQFYNFEVRDPYPDLSGGAYVPKTSQEVPKTSLTSEK